MHSPWISGVVALRCSSGHCSNGGTKTEVKPERGSNLAQNWTNSALHFSRPNHDKGSTMAPTLPRRFSEVYVELPLLSPRMSIGSARSKENLPLSPKANAPHAAARLSKPSKEDVLKEKTKDSGSDKNASDKKRKADDDAESGLAKKLKVNASDT